MSSLEKGKWYQNLDNGTLFRFLELDAFGDIYANETIIDGVWVRSNVCIGEIGSFNFIEVSATKAKSYKKDPIKDPRRLSHRDLEVGKWYFGSDWQEGSCCKFLEVLEDKDIYFTETYVDERYCDSVVSSVVDDDFWSSCNFYSEVPIVYLRAFLPIDHPDLKSQTSNNQINSQSNGKTISSTKDSESAITVSRKSPKIGEVKRTGTSGVHGRRARTTIGWYNPQNKAINSR